jgi:hypothetical protein
VVGGLSGHEPELLKNLERLYQAYVDASDGTRAARAAFWLGFRLAIFGETAAASGSFIDLPIFDDNGEPKHEGGVVSSSPGLYFVGLHFLYAMSSAMIHGVGRDAARIVATLMREREMANAGRNRAPGEGGESNVVRVNAQPPPANAGELRVS